jgi:oligoendopeptidase F
MVKKQGIVLPVKKKRHFLTEEFEIDSWASLEPYLISLRDRSLPDVVALENWLADLSELESVYQESLAWRYIHMTGDTRSAEFESAYNYFASEISPQASPYFNDFRKKLLSSAYVVQLPANTYAIFLRSAKQELDLYREENIPLMTEIDVEAQEYGRILAGMTVRIGEEEMTMQQAGTLLKSTNRALREEAFCATRKVRLASKERLDVSFDKLLGLRHRVALHAGFLNFRDYSFAAMGRFDYTPTDCFNLHAAIASEVVPVLNMFDQERKKALALDTLRPWDMEVDTSGLPALRPFENDKELVEKTIACFNAVDPEFAEYIRIMNAMGHFDLGSRKGKAPGGYNYPLAEIGVPYIFMNAVCSVRDLVTMVHEGGHAIHSFLSRDLTINENKNVPSEVAELASMGMELISMEHWDAFFDKPEDLKRARREQMSKVIRSLPWIALIDKFQHWLYEHPEHTPEQRRKIWLEFTTGFEGGVVDWSGLPEGTGYEWHRQLHIFEVPFYYVEYGFAQLGAIALWRNYKQNPAKAITQYKKALSLGYTRPIGELYEAAGIRFEFSAHYVRELVSFVLGEIKALDETA